MHIFRMGALRAPEGDGAPAAPAATNPPAAAAPLAAPIVPPAAAVAVPPAVAAPSAPPVVAEPPADPEWFNKRITQAKTSQEKATLEKVLKDLGVESLEAAKAKVAAAKALEDEKKTEIEKANERVKALEPDAQKAKTLTDTVAKYAAREMARLTDAQRATVAEFAGDDPQAQLDTIERLSKHGVIAAAVAAPVVDTTVAPPVAAPPVAAPPARAPLAPPASTTAAGTAPPPANTGAPNHQATYESLVKTNPMAAAAYALRHEGEIYRPPT